MNNTQSYLIPRFFEEYNEHDINNRAKKNGYSIYIFVTVCLSS